MDTFKELKREIDIKRDRFERIERRAANSSLTVRYLPGVSVIVPCHQAVGTLGQTLQSLYSQSVDFEEFEVIMVLNGADDGSSKLVSDFASQHPEMNLRVYHNSRLGAGAARNVGLNMVRHKYTTFVDADDFVEKHFLKNALEAMPSHAAIVASPIHNLDTLGRLDSENTLNLRYEEYRGKTVPVAEVPWLLGFNACKLVPSELLVERRYREDLVSGEDLVFFSTLLSLENLSVVFPSSTDGAAYVRRLSQNSVSRKAPSFDFNVKQRVQCMAALNAIDVTGESKKALIMLQRAQASFVKKYLEQNPIDVDRLDALLVEMAFVDFPWNWLNDGKARDLVFSYYFVPYADTSAVIAAKAIAERSRIVDVISASMDKKREKDTSLKFLCSRWLDKSIEVSVAPSFADWKLNIEFAKKALESARNRQAVRGTNYETLYSRALWMGSHIAGALFKIEYPEVIWTAEFSDPLRFDVEGLPRQGMLPIDSDSSMFLEIIAARFEEELEVSTVFDLVEAVTMLLADELLFTNQNQLEYMLSKYPEAFATRVRKKAQVREHPSPRQADYQVVRAESNFSPGRINIAYFGAFYVNRGLGDVFTAIQNLSVSEQNQVCLHIYCTDVAGAKGQVLDLGLSGVVKVHPYLPYLQFLNATTKADVLLVNDIQRSADMEINPFLPSKYSDYRASGTKIWGILDVGSPLSRKPIEYKSENGNVPSSLKVLREIISKNRFKVAAPALT
ncbi:glycosyltransferase [Corynebacterium ammoniagenes]|uniref:Glycosyltransferase, group 2 family protein n=1 Tax=Corynebacterium ammoniagenes DSM 20306 TaxID=649754 RepID=A0ABP2I9T9_CORAM|nr:glycosyltransferase [Corynebacterium ammoniagenes]APT82183.1 hypothetical protein CAMM_04375 [Corynebacterium ammoniagenes DSM 20306]EFG80253.1 glycosyltransferase, group 2 family protein [Corynebacterium ammoniagenes DSM 20306]